MSNAHKAGFRPRQSRERAHKRLLEDNALAGAFVVLLLHLWLYFLPQQGLQWQLRLLPATSPLQLTQRSTARDSPGRKRSGRESYLQAAEDAGAPSLV